jgi:hypothetical protein
LSGVAASLRRSSRSATRSRSGQGGCRSFWFGDDRFSEPAFYAYTAPEPAGLADQPLQPAAAWWDPRNGSHLAVLRYDDARATSDPRASVLGFYESAYQAGARLAGWDIGRLACPGGITDPNSRRHQDLS